MGIKLGLAGLGAFGTVFAPLFASHPLVDAIYLCDAEAEKIKMHKTPPWRQNLQVLVPALMKWQKSTVTVWLSRLSPLCTRPSASS